MGVSNPPSITATLGSPDKETLNKSFLVVKCKSLTVTHLAIHRLQLEAYTPKIQVCHYFTDNICFTIVHYRITFSGSNIRYDALLFSYTNLLKVLPAKGVMFL